MPFAPSILSSTDAHPRTAAENFGITQFRGRYDGVIVPSGDSTSLKELGIDPQDWPQVEWIETDQNQDACLGATLTFAYTGTAGG